jgi:hypothetical protein
MLGSVRHIIALLFLTAFVGAVYYFATNDTFLNSNDRRAVEIENKIQGLKKDIIVPLNRLNAVNLDNIDDTLFETKEFKALEDESVKLPAPALIRVNPFNPAE